jgi:hypothetical protein
MKVILEIIDQHRLNSSVFILDDRDEFDKSFFRYLASSLHFSDRFLGSTMFYALANETKDSFAYYRWGKFNKNFDIKYFFYVFGIFNGALLHMCPICFKKWAPLNGITVKGIVWIMGSKWPRLIKSRIYLNSILL